MGYFKENYNFVKGQSQVRFQGGGGGGGGGGPTFSGGPKIVNSN